MIFFTGLGIFVVALLWYMLLFGLSAVILNDSDNGGYLTAFFVGIILSLIFATFICRPESYGYQKITVSENIVETEYDQE